MYLTWFHLITKLLFSDRDTNVWTIARLGEAHSILATNDCFGIGNHWGNYALVEYLGSSKYMQKHRAEVESKYILTSPEESFILAYVFALRQSWHQKKRCVTRFDDGSQVSTLGLAQRIQLARIMIQKTDSTSNHESNGDRYLKKTG